MEKGWLKQILEQASADRETWPAWQRGFENKTDQAQADRSDEQKDDDAPGTNEVAA